MSSFCSRRRAWRIPSPLLEEVYKSTQTQASLGLATENAVLTARQNLESAQAGRLAMDASEG